MSEHPLNSHPIIYVLLSSYLEQCYTVKRKGFLKGLKMVFQRQRFSEPSYGI